MIPEREDIAITHEPGLAFDHAAPAYDHLESLPGTIRYRKIMMSVYLKYFHPGSHLLELNCGTGTEAVSLAHRGMTVLATDASPAMVSAAERKISATGLGPSVTVRILPFDRLQELHGMQFDGAYSSMGGLNCTNQLDRVSRELAPLVRPDGFFIVSTMTRFSVYESLSFLAHGKLLRVFRRMGNGQVNVQGFPVRTYFYSPREIVTSFSSHFQAVSIIGLNIFAPPPNSSLLYRTHPRFARGLERMDDAVSSVYPFSHAGDHSCVVFKRKPATE